MTRGPRRLKDDPDFQWETGCNLADEESRVGQYDLAGIRDRLVAAAAVVPAPIVSDPPPSQAGPSTWPRMVKPAAGMVAGAMVVAAAYWLGVQAGQEAPRSAPDPAPPVHEVVAPSIAPAPVVAPVQGGTPDEGPIAHPRIQSRAASPSAPQAAPAEQGTAVEPVASKPLPEASWSTSAPASSSRQ